MENSEWKSDMMDSIYKTFTIAYKNDEEFNLIRAQLQTEKWALFLTNAHPDLEIKCQDPAKAILILFAMLKDKNEIVLKNKDEMAERLVIEMVGRLMTDKFKLEECVSFDIICDKEENKHNFEDSLRSEYL